MKPLSAAARNAGAALLVAGCAAGAAAQESLITRMDQIGLALRACWRPPSGISGQDVTVRFAFKRNGEVLGRPRITHYRAGAGSPEEQDAFNAAIRDVFAKCTPLRFSDSLGGAVAGRVFTFRFFAARET